MKKNLSAMESGGDRGKYFLNFRKQFRKYLTPVTFVKNVMGKKKKYRTGNAVWVELEIESTYHGNIKFLIRDNEGREEWIYIGCEKVAVIIDQLIEWIEEGPTRIP